MDPYIDRLSYTRVVYTSRIYPEGQSRGYTFVVPSVGESSSVVPFVTCLTWSY